MKRNDTDQTILPANESSKVTGKFLIDECGIKHEVLLDWLSMGLVATFLDDQPLVGEDIGNLDNRKTVIRQALGENPQKAVEYLVFEQADLIEFAASHPDTPFVDRLTSLKIPTDKAGDASDFLKRSRIRQLQIEIHELKKGKLTSEKYDEIEKRENEMIELCRSYPGSERLLEGFRIDLAKKSNGVSAELKGYTQFPFYQKVEKWADVKIAQIDNENVRIEIRGEKKLFSYHELYMANTRNKRPIQIWDLFKAFAYHSGRIDSSAKRKEKYLPNVTKRLNKHMKKLFGINESIYKYDYRVEKAYITRIEFTDERDPRATKAYYSE